MKTCPNPQCNTSGIPEDAKFCPVCGKEFPVLAQTVNRKRRDKQQLLQEASATWDALPFENKNKHLVHNTKIVFYSALVIIAIFLIIGLFQEGGLSFDGVKALILVFGGFCLGLILVVAIPGYMADKKAQKAFIEQYIQKHEYELS